MTAQRDGHTATLLPSGKVLIAGGTELLDTAYSAELYAPASAAFTATTSLITPRRDHTATLLRTGKVLIAGGFAEDFKSCASTELYY
jgi:hypothetical protein